MIVPDASAVALLFADGSVEPRAAEAAEALRRDPAWVVPEHWRTEVLSVVRGLNRGGKLDVSRAGRAVDWLAQVTTMPIPTASVLGRMWELRDSLSVYDAGYVAVAERYEIPLVTADARLVRAGVARCPVHLLA